jgi:hypothetical protein
MRTVSQIYQDLESPAVGLNYEVPLYPEIPPGVIERILNPLLSNPYPIGTTPAHLDPSRSTAAVRVDFRLSASQLSELRAGVLASAPLATDAASPRISSQDALVAVIAATITEVDKEAPPISRILTIFNVSSCCFLHSCRSRTHMLQFRGVGLHPTNAAGNALINPFAEVDTAQANDMYALASSVRQSLLACKNADYVDACMVASGNKFQAAAENNHGLDFTPEPGLLSVNSTRPLVPLSFHHPLHDLLKATGLGSIGLLHILVTKAAHPSIIQFSTHHAILRSSRPIQPVCQTVAGTAMLVEQKLRSTCSLPSVLCLPMLSVRELVHWV